MEVTVLPVRAEADIGQARREVKRLATEIGFDAAAVAELAIVATELATNLVQHRTIDGEIIVTVLGNDHGDGIEIVSTDSGPGICDIAAALEDRYSTAGTNGCGLGAVRRLMHEFDIYSTPTSEPFHCPDPRAAAAGTVIATRKWLETPADTRRLAYSVKSRPYPGETANGDAVLVREDRQGLMVAVADGLGHGAAAEQASVAALAYVRENANQDIARLLVRLHEDLRGTRGIALTIVRLCLPERLLVHAGIGNVTTHLYPRGQSSLLTRPGVLGVGRVPAPRVDHMPWPDGGTLIVHTDGISRSWDFDAMPGLLERHVTTVGQQMMRGYARSNDDATVVVARELA